MNGLKALDENKRLHADQVKQLYKHTPIGVAATVVNSFILSFILWEIIPHEILIIWLTICISAAAFRYLLFLKFYRSSQTPAESDSWEMWFIISLAFSGIVWGSAGIFLFPANSIAHQTFIAFVLGGMVAGAAGTFSIILRAFIYYSLPALLPIIIRFFIIGDHIHLAMGAMLLLFGFLMFATAKRLNAATLSSLQLQLENSELISNLVTEKEHIEKLNKNYKSEITERKMAEEALQKARRLLEQRVKERTAELTRSNEQLKCEIEERRLTEEALRESEERFKNIVENALVWIWEVDAGGKYTYSSPFVKQILGYKPEEVVGKHFYHFFHPEKREEMKAAAFEVIGRKQAFQGFINRTVNKDGKTVWLSTRGVPIFDEEGNCIGYRGTDTDITEAKLLKKEKKKLEVKLQHSQKMKAVGILAGGIAHDFNNLLQTIYGFTEMLLMKKDPRDPDYNRLKQIDQTAQRAGELIEQLLIFGRLVESKLRPTELNREVEQVSKLLERTIPKMISLEFRPAKNLNVINADQAQIEQILMNLGINARDALPEGGRLLFETENVTLDEQYCLAHPGAVPGEYVLLSVSDTGCGMGKDILEHIFEPFYTTKEIGKGTGLGLAMVYGIIKSHDGYITCESEPGQGTTFKIYFPVFMTESPVPKRIERKEVELSGGRETILVVDDAPLMLETVEAMLESYGYKTILAESGEKAIEKFGKQKDFIDLVILDVGMPGMGGLKCLERLLELDSTVKVIIASGYAPNGNIKKVIETCAVGYIRKPYRLADILGKVREVADKKWGF